MRDLTRLIGPVPMADAHLLSPFPSIDNVADHLGRAGTDLDAPIWFFERVRVAQVDPVTLVHRPTEVQRARMNRIQRALRSGSRACAVLHHTPTLPAHRGEFTVVDGRLALTAAQRGHVNVVLAWVAHQRQCCPAGSTPLAARCSG